jgi:hypothetical protein
MSLQASSIADSLIASLNQLDRLKFTDLMSNYNNTIALKRIFREKKATIESGPEVQFNVIFDTNKSARHVPLAYVNRIDIPNVLGNGKMPWRHTTWNWALERRLVAMNAGNSKIIDLAQSQRIASLGDAILLFERTLWTFPASTDDVTPVGIPYFVVKSATDAATDTTANGFNGGAPSGYTLVANINPSTQFNGRYKNYADAYTSISKTDLISKMRRAQYYTDFEPLVDDIPQHDLGNDYQVLTNYKVRSKMVEILESQNEDLGSDIAPMEGKVMFLRTPIVAVKQLDNDTDDPLYMLNWGVMGAQALRGEWMNEQHFKAELNQPTISATVTDCSWNLWCTNRRKQAVLSTGTSGTAA